MNRSDLKSIIKKIIKEELIEEDQIEEISSAGGSAGAASGDIKTPNAFAGKGSAWKGGEFAEDSMPNPDSRKSNVVDEEEPDKLTEARARYYNFRESSKYKKDRSKVSYTIREMKKMLDEVNYLANITLRLKRESGVESSNLWKRSERDIKKIQNSATAILQKTKNLK